MNCPTQPAFLVTLECPRAQCSPAAQQAWCAGETGAAEIPDVFHYREKLHEHPAANRSLPHPSVECEIWAPGQPQWPHAGQVTGMSPHLFRCRSCKNLGNLGDSVASALVPLWTVLLMALCAEIQENIPSFPLVPWEGCGQSRHFCARGSCCLLLKQELVQNPAQAERYSRHLLWRVFLLSYCWKGEEDKTFAVFSPYTQEINCAGNTAVFFTQF